MKRLLLGDEALALGAIHAGLSGVYAYPGTPSTEITEFIQTDPVSRERGLHSRWCTNEKTAMEAALGMSFAGKRALVCMKHVGMNVCADGWRPTIRPCTPRRTNRIPAFMENLPWFRYWSPPRSRNATI